VVQCCCLLLKREKENSFFDLIRISPNSITTNLIKLEKQQSGRKIERFVEKQMKHHFVLLIKNNSFFCNFFANFRSKKLKPNKSIFVFDYIQQYQNETK